MDEGDRSALKVPLLILPDRGLEVQMEVNVVTHQKSGKSYMIPLLILPKSTAPANSTSGGPSCNDYAESLYGASDADIDSHEKRENLRSGNKTDEMIENGDYFDAKYSRSSSSR